MKNNNNNNNNNNNKTGSTATIHCCANIFINFRLLFFLRAAGELTR